LREKVKLRLLLFLREKRKERELCAHKMYLKVDPNPEDKIDER
jgi:hypothetical protein